MPKTRFPSRHKIFNRHALLLNPSEIAQVENTVAPFGIQHFSVLSRSPQQMPVNDLLRNGV